MGVRDGRGGVLFEGGVAGAKGIRIFGDVEGGTSKLSVASVM